MLRNVSLGLVCALLAACGSARFVNRSQYGGTIALNGNRSKAMEQAHRRMSEHCGPNNYTIIREGETVVGSDTDVVSKTQYDANGNEIQSAGSSTRDTVEWRIEYQCGGAPAAPMGQPPGPPGPPPPPPGPPPGRI